MSNPWADRWQGFGSYADDPGEAEMLRLEAEDARARPSVICPCGSQAYYRPGVGAYQCPTCRKLRVSRWDQETEVLTTFWA